MYGDEEFNNPVIDLAGYREERMAGNVISLEGARSRHPRAERKFPADEKMGAVIMFSARRMAALSGRFV